MGHKERALDYMRKYGGITNKEASSKLANVRLSDTIFRLRNEGYNIINVPKHKKNKYNEKTHYVQYVLIENRDLTEKEMYELYEDVRKSGITNMFNLRLVSDLTGLNKEQIIFVMDHYAELKNKYEGE